MSDPDSISPLKGENLQLLMAEVRRRFLAPGHGGSTELPSSTRLVAIEVYDSLTVEAQLQIAVDLLRENDEIVIRRNTDAVFSRSDTARAYVADLISEVVHQELMDDPVVRIEEELRAGLMD